MPDFLPTLQLRLEVQMTVAINKNGRSPKIDLAAQRSIGRQLRAMYADVLRQPLPGNLSDLLRSRDRTAATRERFDAALHSPRQARLEHSEWGSACL